jgi:hypothetical protein
MKLCYVSQISCLCLLDPNKIINTSLFSWQLMKELIPYSFKLPFQGCCFFIHDCCSALSPCFVHLLSSPTNHNQMTSHTVLIWFHLLNTLCLHYFLWTSIVTCKVTCSLCLRGLEHGFLTCHHWHLVQILFLVEGCPVSCRIFSSIPSLYPQDAKNTLLLTLQNVFKLCQLYPDK